MDIEWVRDVVICVSGVVAIGVLVFIAVLAYLFYQRSRTVLNEMEVVSDKTKYILDSIETTTTTIKGISSYVADEMVRPVIQVAALIQGIRQGIETMSRFFKKEEGGRNG